MLKKLFFLFILICLSLLIPSKVFAADTPIPQLKFPCNLTDNPEFASLRPYQAAVCGDAAKAYYCSNSLIFTETFNDFPQCEAQAPPEGQFDCQVNKYIPDHTVSVDLADVNEPILGNTDQTKNSKSSADSLDNGTKVSEYLSWYLGGTTNKAEYGSTSYVNPSDWAGPIQKIMPGAILDSQRIKTINNIKTQVPQVDTEEVSTGKTEPANHDQIVVCADHDGSGFWSGLQDFLGLGKYSPIDCYKGGGAKASGDLVMRLSDWNATLGTNVVINSIIQGFINGLKIIYPFIPSGVIEQSISDHWTYAVPPLPWDDGTGKPFETSAMYQKAYAEWRGNICAIVPIVNIVVCVNNIFVPTKYADLYSYIPLANTTDTHGAEADFIAEIQPSQGTEIENSSYDIPISSPLWTAHNQEVKELSEFLNTSYQPKGIQNVQVPADTEPAICRVVRVSTNQGDDTFAGQPHGIIVNNVHYTITQVRCVARTETKTNTPNHPNVCPGGIGESCTNKTVKCDAEINITLPTVTKTPWADEIWRSTVANSASTFRRIYPKPGNGAPVTCIADNPASSGVTYTPHDTVGNGQDNFKVKDPTGANTTDNPQLLFPHLASVYDYFLQGIQQALRPQGMGTGTPESGQECSNIACGELPKGLPKGTGSCSLGSVSKRVGNIPQSLKDIVEAAAQTYQTPPNLILGIMYGEGLFNTDANGNFNRFQWNETNVKNWATCQKIPNCHETGDDNFMGFNGNDFKNIAPKIINDLKKLDPTKNVNTLSQCNLLDTIYAEAYNLHATAAGGGGLPPTCFGIPLQSTIPNSCSWNDNQYESAIKVAETGYTKDCLTLENGCAIGGGLDAACPNGDNCEQLHKRYAQPSHNACVWDVGHGY